MKITSKRATISLIFGISIACLVAAFWFRCQTRYHCFECQYREKNRVMMESYRDGMVIEVSSSPSPFMEGSDINWVSFPYPEPDMKYLAGFGFDLGYPLRAASGSSLISVPYWLLIIGSSIFAGPLVLYRRMKKAEQFVDDNPS